MSGFSHEAPIRGATNDWYTPAWVFAAIGLDFDLDPCSPSDRVLPWIPAARRYTESDDGLVQPWTGSVWLNPPYGEQTGRWLAKLAAHGDGLALVHSRTDTAWFHDAAARADAMLLFRGRLRFVNQHGRPGSQPTVGSVLLAWGLRHVHALDRVALAEHGMCVRLPRLLNGAQAPLPLKATA